MVTWALVLETLVKWGIPVIAAAIIGFIVKRVIDPKKKDNAAGVKLRLQQNWDDAARNSTVLQEKCAVQVGEMSKAIDIKFEQAKAENRLVDEQILAAVRDLQLSMNEIKDELKEQKDTQTLLQSGVLDMHLHNLIQTCKVYIERGYITHIELMQYNERLTLYHKLGGNGHMDIWDERIRALPLHDHSEK